MSEDTTSKACLIAATLDGQGGWQTFDTATGTPPAPPAGSIYWLHINASHPEAKRFLSTTLGLPVAAVTSLLREEIRPRYVELGDNSMIFLRGITFVPGPEPGDLASLRLWVTPQGIISAGRRKSHVASVLKKRLDSGDGPRNVAGMVTSILDILNDALEPLIQEVDENLEAIEDEIPTDNTVSTRHRFAELRRVISQYRRHLSPQRDMLSRLVHAQRNWMDTDTRWQVQEAFDRTTRFIEDLDTLRERAEIVSDDITNAQSMKLNRNLYLLSVITVIFMPLTFITGLLGMNVEGIPGASHPHAFALIVGLSALIIAVQIFIFRRVRWL